MLIALLVFLPIVCGLLAFAAGERTVLPGSFAACAAALVLALFTAALHPSLRIGGVFAAGLSFTATGFQGTYAVVTAVMWLFTTLFAFEYFEEEPEHLNRYWMFVLVTLGATEGVMLSGDLMTSFVFFELLSFTSFTWVIHEETPEAVKAGKTYLAVAVIGGLVLFIGLLLMMHGAGTLEYAALREIFAGEGGAFPGGGEGAASGTGALLPAPGSRTEILAAGICILLGFGAKAGMFPLHIWLPKAHPVAPSPASALLSGVLTKVGIYGILMTATSVFTGNVYFGLIILALGLITMALGAVLALFSVNLKRTLACSSMSQIGFILTGLAMATLHAGEGSAELAVAGAMLHMVNHSMIKLTLFMAAGVVVMNAHTLTLNEIRGFGRKKGALKLAFALGALGISGVPLFGGYISKTLLHEGIVEGFEALEEIGEAAPAAASAFRAPAALLSELPALLHCAEWIFLISGGITFAYMLKLFICIFVERNEDPERQRRYDGDTSAGGAASREQGHAPREAGRPYMNRLSGTVIVGSSFAMAVLGQPAVMLRLAAFMTGDGSLAHHFHAFAWNNIKGGLISLSVGAVLYLAVVRKVLYRRGAGYVNLWPASVDLEDRLYRPLLLRWLPGFFGGLVQLFGENRVLKPFTAAVFKAAGLTAQIFGENRILKPLSSAVLYAVGQAAELFGENKVLRPMYIAAVETAAFLSRVFSDGTDAFVWLMRKTIFRERKVITASDREGRAEVFLEETERSVTRFGENFTFVLMMTCIGILIILGTMIWMMR